MSSPRYDAIIFDLDGTLVDSAPGILGAFAAVLDEFKLTPRIALDAALIGPPLAETLARLCGTDSPATIQPLADAFKRRYDRDAVGATPAYPDVPALLAGLRAAGIELGIATNKRLAPALAILEHLGLHPHFASVYALDMRVPRLPDKAAMIDLAISERGLERERIAYVGDKDEDGHSADANGLEFFAADWGYGDFAGAPAHWRRAASPRDLLAQLLAAR